MVNVYCANWGWLFEDIKKQFSEHYDVVCTDSPIEADSYICVRTMESRLTPPEKTLVQVHDLFDWTIDPRCHLSLTNPDQVKNGTNIKLNRAIGAREGFFDSSRLPRKNFTVGWCGRMNSYKGGPFLDLVLNSIDCDVILMGRKLKNINCSRAEKYECKLSLQEHKELYSQLDCLLITSTTEGGPLTLFEALACGVPVVSTPVGWAKRILPSDFIVNTYGEMVKAIEKIRSERDRHISLSNFYKSLSTLTHESWIEENIDVARFIASSEFI